MVGFFHLVSILFVGDNHWDFGSVLGGIKYLFGLIFLALKSTFGFFIHLEVPLGLNEKIVPGVM
jgi:hypothetical protein